MLPSPSTHVLYPSDTAFWSIFAELLVNLVFAAALVRLPRAGLWTVCLLCAVLLGALIHEPHFADGGAAWADAPLGLARTLFSFTVGCLLANAPQLDGRRRSWAAPALVVMLFAFLLARPETEYRRFFDLVSILVAFPLILAAGILLEMPMRLRRSAAFLGDLSYPLYAVHEPVRSLLGFVAQRHILPTSVLVALYLLAAVALAAVLEHFWDRPVRRVLSTRLQLRPSARPQVL